LQLICPKNGIRTPEYAGDDAKTTQKHHEASDQRQIAHAYKQPPLQGHCYFPHSGAKP
jgi:hypothetical protein